MSGSNATSATCVPGTLNGFYREDAPDGFPAVALHESRHSWQYSLKNWPEARAVDQDNDLLIAPEPSASWSDFPGTWSDLFDGPNFAAPGGVNGDGHFNGDGIADNGEPSHSMRERNAQRYTFRFVNTAVTTRLDCALSTFAVVSGDGQVGPGNQDLSLPLLVRVQQKKYMLLPVVTVIDVPAPGVTVMFTVPEGSTAKVAGGSRAFVMTDETGSASVPLTNGAASTTIVVTLLPPMTQNVCSFLSLDPTTHQPLPLQVTLNVQ